MAEEDPVNENSLAASQTHTNEPRRTDLAGPAATSDAVVIEGSVAVPECFAEIFDRHAESIQRYAARRLGQQAAADVMSKVFLAAFRNRRRYDTGRDDARPWLCGIAVNVISQHQRAQRRYARVLAAVPYLPATDVVAGESLTASLPHSCARGSCGCSASSPTVTGYVISVWELTAWVITSTS